MRILFITATRIGDAVLTTGLLKHLIDTYPEAHFTIACGPVAADLFRAVPRLDRLILLKKRKGNLHWIKLWHDCVSIKWDMIIDLRNSMISRLLYAKQKAYPPCHKSGRHKIYDLSQTLNLKEPAAPHIWTDGTAEQKAKELIPSDTPLLGLGPSANWPPKQWPTYRFAELAQKLTDKGAPLEGAKIIIAAAAHELDQLRPVLTALPTERIINIVGEDLLTVAACLQKADLFIGNDSGLSHLAAAMDTPTLALFGPGLENIYSPWGKHVAIARSPISTKDLLKRLSTSTTSGASLMEELSVETAHQKAIELLKSMHKD